MLSFSYGLGHIVYNFLWLILFTVYQPSLGYRPFRLARFLGAKGAAIDWLPLARIARWTGRAESCADQSRNRVAREYARATAN